MEGARTAETHVNGSSRRDIGQSWKTSYGSDMPLLFGAGGEQDGNQTALINTTKNIQKEDELALVGTGDRTIDTNEYKRAANNSNPEFNFSQFKSGATGTENYEQQVTVPTASGYMNMRVNPYDSVFDQTSQAFGALYGGVYKLNAHSSVDESRVKLGVNPFAPSNARGGGDEGDDGSAEMEQDGGADDDNVDDINYYYQEAYQDKSADAAIQAEHQNGLRRVNIRTNQKRQLERVAQVSDIIKAHQEATDAYATTLKDHFNAAYMSEDDRVETIEKLHYPTAKYGSAQHGVGDVSRDSERAHKGKRSNIPTKLNSVLVGV